MKTSALAVKPAVSARPIDQTGPAYRDALTFIERLHRRLLDVIRDELDQPMDLNPAQALLLYNLGDKQLTVSELRTRGCYLGSNVSYNLKKLVEDGFVEHQRSCTDRRAVSVRLTEKGRAVHDLVAQLFDNHVIGMVHENHMDAADFAVLKKVLLRLERFWSDQIIYRL
jgi:DNA-binding MarR family transcriptional regulator